MAFSASYIYQIRDQYSGPIKKIARATKHYAGTAKRAEVSTRRLGKSMQKLSSKTANLGNVMATGAVFLGLKKLASESMAFEDALSDVNRVIGFKTAKTMQKFDKQLESMSENLGKSKVGLAQIAFEGGRLGVAEENIVGFVNQVAKMAVAFDMTDEEAGKMIGSIQAKLNMTGESMIKLADRINYLADNTSAAGASMMNIVQRTAGFMNLLKVPPEVIASFAGFADQIEVTSELSASALNMMFGRMMQSPKLVKKLLEDPMGAVREEFERFAKMPEHVRISKIYKQFGNESGRFVIKAVENLKLLDKTVKVATSGAAVGSMDREMLMRMERNSTKVARLRATVTNTLASLGDSLMLALAPIIPIFASIVDSIGEFTDKHPAIASVVLMITAFAASVAGALVVVGMIAGPIGTAISLIAKLGLATKLTAIYTKGLAAAQWVWNIAMGANPIVLIVLAVISLVAAIWRVYAAWDILVAAWENSTGVISGIIDVMGAFFGMGDASAVSASAELAIDKNVNINQKQEVGIDMRVKTDKGQEVTDIKTTGQDVGLNVATAGAM